MSKSMTRSVQLLRNVESYSTIRKFCYKLVKHPLFEMFIVFCILLNTISLCFDTYPCIIILLLNSKSKYCK